MSKNALEFFELDGRQVRHVPCDQLILQKRELLRNATGDKGVFVKEFVIGISRVVVFFNRCLFALSVEVRQLGEVRG